MLQIIVYLFLNPIVERNPSFFDGGLQLVEAVGRQVEIPFLAAFLAFVLTPSSRMIRAVAFARLSNKAILAINDGIAINIGKAIDCFA